MLDLVIRNSDKTVSHAIVSEYVRAIRIVLNLNDKKD